MPKFKLPDEIFNAFEVTSVNEFVCEEFLYKFIRRIEKVERGWIKNLTCLTFRNEEEHHNINVYYTEEQIEFVETGYSFS